MAWLFLMLLLLLWTALSWPQGLPTPGPGVKGYAAGGGVVRTGTPTTTATSTANTGSISITIPSDANFLLCEVNGYSSTSTYFSTGSMTIAGAAMTLIGGGDSNSAYMGIIAYKVSPTTGTQTLAWDWLGTTAGGETHVFSCAFYKGVNTSTPVRSSSCTQSASGPHTSGTLTAVSGDLLVAWSWSSVSSENTFTFTSATKIQDFTKTSANSDTALAETAPTGNQTVACSNSPDNFDGGICGIVLRP